MKRVCVLGSRFLISTRFRWRICDGEGGEHAGLKRGADEDEKEALANLQKALAELKRLGFTHVLSIPDSESRRLHAAVDTGGGEWARCVDTNAQRSGDLLYHCRTAKGFVLCSTGFVNIVFVSACSTTSRRAGRGPRCRRPSAGLRSRARRCRT